MAIITKRPQQIRIKDIDDIQPDLTITDGSVSYHCWNYFKPADLNSWKIMRVTTSIVGGTTTIKNEYPFGCATYNFNPDDAATYDYSYKF